MEFITLTKSDPEFNNYLLGTFSKKLRALPVETYHPQTPRERVTFQVVPVSQVQAPAWWKIYFLSCRPELMGLTLGTSVAAWLNQREWIAGWSRWPSWLALLGIFFLHTSVFLLNDVQDHLRGQDRLNRQRGSQVIQKGWVSARAMKDWAWVNLGFAIVLALPAILHAPFELAIVCLISIFCLATWIFNMGTRYGLADLALFLLFGPLLTSGIALASFGVTNQRDLALGLALGTLTLWCFQVRQFETLFRTLPGSTRTFLGFWDFDRARRMGVWMGGLVLLLQPLIGWFLQVPPGLLWLCPLVSLPALVLMLRLNKAASPLSSSLVNSPQWALAAHFAWTLWWILTLGWQWL